MVMSKRTANVNRNTRETQISVGINIDGSGKGKFDTDIPFFEHMLDQIARHGMFDLEITARGDLDIDGPSHR
jgi:imidazoleglycerol-phosphate dehydratase